MKERPFKTVRETFKKSNSDEKELMKVIFEKNDSILLWLTGLSIGVIAALSSQFKDLNTLFNGGEIKCIFFFLFISVICGILYRILYLRYYILMDGGFRQIDIALSESKMVETELELDGTESINTLIEYNSEYQDLPNFLELYNKSDSTGKENTYKYLVGLYNDEKDFAKKEYDLAIDTVNESFKLGIGINLNLNNLNDILINKPVKAIKFLRVTTRILYIAFIVSFLFAIGYLLCVVKFPNT
jgi:hypothetical protein